jgi:hypothetical protein
MDLLVGSGMSILCHLALRMVTQSGLQYFLDIKGNLHESSQPNMHPGDSYVLKAKAPNIICSFWRGGRVGSKGKCFKN